ncbi:hypothetical protein QCN29_25010 [Streptomyces sp. HNM0663]|uniref:Uncharacterized protein n=1 Tax=Streptomyces chengmaiensis TaxID=3040919 RepID=A0ABT6HUI4_9ACTN|nr:hypothetical protein [Streptomyces chengmaiensis]MDH2391981.1 hypothetical protein [Streptomyces chengmaiensis]
MTDLIRVLAVRARLLYRPRVDGRHHARVADLAYRPVADSPAALSLAWPACRCCRCAGGER